MSRPSRLTPFAMAMSLSTVAGAGPFSPGGAGAPPAAEDLVQARMIAAHDGFRPGGTTEIAFTFDIQDGWHLYWVNPGDTGMQMMVEFDLPEGFEAGTIVWPAPMRYIHSGMVDYIHEDELTLLVPITAPRDAEVGAEVRIGARLDWLVCKDICLPGDADVALTLPIRNSDPRAATGDSADRIERARRRHPKTPGIDDGVRASWTGGATLTITARGADELLFFPLLTDDPEAARRAPMNILDAGRVRRDTMTIRYRPEIRDADLVGGVLEVRRGGASSFFRIEVPGPGAG